MKQILRFALLLAMSIPMAFSRQASPGIAQTGSFLAQAGPWVEIPAPFLAGGSVDALAAADSDPDVLYALVQSSPGDALFRSSDGGDHWELRYQFTSQARSARQFQIGIDPHNPDLLYVDIVNDLMRSGDGGYHWEHISPFGEAFAVARSDLVYATGRDPNDSGSCGVPNQHAYFFQSSPNGGTTWETLSTICVGEVNLLVASRSNPEVIYLTGFGMDLDNLRSEDGGKTWTAFNFVDGADIWSLVVDSADPARLYASGSAGFASSPDGGQTWLQSGEDIGAYHHLAYSGTSVYAIRTVPQPCRVYRSEDHGASWWESLSGLPAGALALTADRSGRLYAGLYGYGVYRSDNGGSAWSEKNEGIQTPATVYKIAVGTASAGTIYALTTQPYPALLRTNDFGASWEKPYRGELGQATGAGFVRAGLSAASAELEAFSIDHILTNPANPEIAWAGGYSGLFETNDGGLAWNAVNTSVSVIDLAVSNGAPNQPYALVYESGGWIQVFQKHCELSAGCWFVNSTLNMGEVTLIASDSHDSRHLYASLRGYDRPVFFESQDSAASWQFVSHPDIPVRIEALAVSPGDPKVLLAVTSPNELYAADPPIYRSQDGGLTWLNWSQGISTTNVGYSPLVLDGLEKAYYGGFDGLFIRGANDALWQPFDLEGIIYDLAVYSNQQQYLYAATSHGLWMRTLPAISHSWLPVIGGD